LRIYFYNTKKKIIYLRQDDDLTEKTIMLKKVPSNVSDISDDNASGNDNARIKYTPVTFRLYLIYYSTYLYIKCIIIIYIFHLKI